MYAELVINIAAPLEGTFHYHVPGDMEPQLQPGHLVEVEFGSRLAQAIVLAFSREAPVPETKPIIALVDPQPVVRPWQVELARWLSQQYLAPLNACLRLMLPPGLTRWSDITLALNPAWDGAGIRTEAQQQLVELLRQKGDRRGRQIAAALPKTKWREAATQLVNREILLRGSVLDAPRARPRQVKTAELIAGPRQIREAALHLGRKNLQAAILATMLASPDPLPAEEAVLAASGAAARHVHKLIDAGILHRVPPATILYPVAQAEGLPAPLQAALARLPAEDSTLEPEMRAELARRGLVQAVAQPASLSLAVPASEALSHLFRLRAATAYERVLRLLAREAQPLPLSDIYAGTGTNLSHLRKLARLDLIRLRAEEVWRDPLADRDFVPAEAPELTHDQARAWGQIKLAMLGAEPEADEGGDGPVASRPILLYGVTGSGKTEIYMRAIALALQRGQRALVLVPEIALTPQTVRRFAARFPGRVAVQHSRLSDGERYDTWRRARRGLFDIVVGPRSALFLPLDRIGVIVVDEEHDDSYKQTPPVPAPYYHAREAAIALGRLLGATVILGSATPDIVSYHRARAGKYRLLELPRRIMGHRKRLQSQAERLHLPASRYHSLDDDPDDALTIPLPPVQVVDLRQELRSGNRSIFSRALQQAIDDTLARQEQAILFLNRRGTASFILCRDCGLVLACPRCGVPLTYHRPHRLLVCHHCGRREPTPAACPQCGSSRIKFFGLGTEELEARVRARWPQARLVRWDRDTTAGKDSHETLLASFINREADILVGTQMIAKGLDLPFVTLVGVVSADVSLGLPDYSTGERAFQVLAQVAGRAGRGLLGGRVILQTYQPDHYAIRAAAEHDFVSFYLEEIRFRTRQGLPPFRRLARLVLADPVEERGHRAGEELASLLRAEVREQALVATEVLGPTPPFFSRLGGRYLWQIVIRSPDPGRLLQAVKVPANWVVDIDPVSTL